MPPAIAHAPAAEKETIGVTVPVFFLGTFTSFGLVVTACVSAGKTTRPPSVKAPVALLYVMIDAALSILSVSCERSARKSATDKSRFDVALSTFASASRSPGAAFLLGPAALIARLLSSDQLSAEMPLASTPGGNATIADMSGESSRNATVSLLVSNIV